MTERFKDYAKLIVSLFYFVLVRLPYRLLARPRALPLFNYHGVEAREVRRFRRQLEFLRRRWRFVPLAEILPALEGGPFQPRTAHLCFDDALQCVNDHALPVLREMGIPCTVLVPTSLVGGTMVPPGPPDPLMSWESIRRLDSPSIRFESHTASHRLLPFLPEEEVREELRSSRRVLEEKLGRVVECVCYPRGYCDERTKALARESGYRIGLSTLTHTDLAADRFDVPRLLLRPSFSLLEVWLISEGGYNWLTVLARLRRWRRRSVAQRAISRK